MRRFLEKIQKGSGCWEWLACKTEKGYGQFWIDGSMRRAHRVAYELFVGDIEDGMCVLHSCDNRSCVNPDHLFLGSQQDNMLDMYKKGRGLKATCEGHGATLLCNLDAWLIKNITGIRQQVIADWFGISQQTVSRIRNGQVWKRIEVGL